MDLLEKVLQVNMNYLVIISILLLSFNSAAQTVPSERLTDWTKVGLQGEKVYPTEEINFLDEGGIADGLTANDAIISSILTAHTGDSILIYFPAGTYFFESTIALQSNIVLKGESAGTSFLTFNLGGSDHCIRSTGAPTADTSDVVAAISKDQNSCMVQSTSTLAAGDWVKIIDEDSLKITSSWSEHKTGQLMQIENRVGDELFFKSIFRRDYLIEESPRLIKLTMRENIGIENLSITRLDVTTSQTDNVHFRYTVNSWVDCIRSYSSNFSHVRMEFANNCEVTGSYFKDGFDYGEGGRAYGVVCQFASGDCLINTNIFEHLRHSMLLQAGANGNVYSYNYSFDPYWTDVGVLPDNSAGEITLHGNYVYCNLFEGNECQNIVIDDSHGINGPYNTFLRNRALGYGLVMNGSSPTDSQNFIGNEISNTSMFMGTYSLEGIDHFEHGNNQNGTCIPASTETVSANSYYLSLEPYYYSIYSEWPAIGYPNALNDNKNEPRINFEKGFITTCENTFADLSFVERFNERFVYPNPSSGIISISGYLDDEISTINVVDIKGETIHVVRTKTILDLSHNANGIYFINVITHAGEMDTYKIVLHQ